MQIVFQLKNHSKVVSFFPICFFQDHQLVYSSHPLPIILVALSPLLFCPLLGGLFLLKGIYQIDLSTQIDGLGVDGYVFYIDFYCIHFFFSLILHLYIHLFWIFPQEDPPWDDIIIKIGWFSISFFIFLSLNIILLMTFFLIFTLW